MQAGEHITHTSRNVLCFIAAYGLLILTASAGVAQEVKIEPVISYEYGYPLTIERTPGIVNHFHTSGIGTSYNHTIGISASFEMPDIFSEGFGVAPRLGYRLGIGKFTSEPFTSTVHDSGNIPISSTHHFEVSSITHSFDLTLPFLVSARGIGFGLGPWVSAELSRSLTGTEYIDAPTSSFFADGSTSREFAAGDSISVSHLHAGLEAEILFHIPLSESLALEPCLFARLDLASSPEVRAKAYSAGLSFALCPVSLHRSEGAPTRDTAISEAPHAPTKLIAEIHFSKNGVRTDRETPIEVVGYSTFNRQYTELPQVLTFSKSSATISPSYRLRSASQTAAFSLSSLARSDLGAFGAEEINVIGMRMAIESATTLEVSTGAKHHVDNMLDARVAAIQAYLDTAWRIDPRRIIKTARVSSATTPGKDTLRLTGPSLLLPVATQWIEQSYRIPHMGIEKSIIANAGLRSWKVEVRQGGRVLTSFNSADEEDATAIADFDLGGDSTENDERLEPAPLVATLYAEDFTGQHTMAFDTLVLPSRDQQQQALKHREEYTFVFLSDDVAFGGPAYSEAMMRKLLELVKPDSRITLSDPPHDPRVVAMASLSITERIVSDLKRRTDLHPEIHIITRPESEAQPPPYERAVIVRISQTQ